MFDEFPRRGWAEIGFAQREGGVSPDAGEQVVEFVSHAAGEGADALNFLSLQKLAFQMPALAHVADNTGQVGELTAGIEDRRDGQRYLDQPAVL